MKCSVFLRHRRVALGAVILVLLALLSPLAFRKRQQANVPSSATVATTQVQAATAPVLKLPPVTRRQVDRSIERAKSFLLANRLLEVWEPDIGLAVARGEPLPPNFGERTVRVAQALLEAGASAKSPEISAAVAWLQRRNPLELRSSRAIAGRLQLALQLPPECADRRQLRDDVQALLKRQSPTSAEATLALAGLADRPGIELPATLLRTSDDAWHSLVKEILNDHPSADASAATAVMPLARAVEVLLAIDDARKLRVDCNALPSDPVIDDAIAELSRRYARLYVGSVSFEAIDQFARAMRAAGLKYAGGAHDWYAEATAFVLAAQRPDGSWGDGPADTANALRFLAGARAPVIAQKLAYDADHGPVGRQPGAWNNRPRDLARLAQWMGRQSGRPLDWRLTRDDAPVEEWLESPILFISGGAALDLGAQTRQKLADYVQRGGVIVANAECESAAFVESFCRLGRGLFPNHEFREMPATHALFRGLPSAAQSRPPTSQILALSNGKREVMLLLPRDAAKAWAMGATAAPSRRSAELGANLVRYAAADAPLLGKDETIRPPAELPAESASALATAQQAWPKRDPDAGPIDLGDLPQALGAPPPPMRSVTLAMVGGAFDPSAQPPFPSIRTSLQQHGLQLTVDTVALGQWTLQRYDTAWTTGARLLDLSALQRMEVLRFLETGGHLVIDVSSGPKSADRVEGQIVSLFAPRLRIEFAPATPNDKEIPVRISDGIRLARIDGRGLVAVTANPAKADALVEILLTGRENATAPRR
jgi:hypothetical protein